MNHLLSEKASWLCGAPFTALLKKGGDVRRDLVELNLWYRAWWWYFRVRGKHFSLSSLFFSFCLSRSWVWSSFESFQVWTVFNLAMDSFPNFPPDIRRVHTGLELLGYPLWGDNDFFKYFWKDKVASTVGKLSLLDDPLDYLPPSYYIFLCPKTLSINF